jgi:hypothetical protein
MAVSKEKPQPETPANIPLGGVGEYEYIEVWGVGVMPLLMHGFLNDGDAASQLPGGTGKGTRAVATAGAKLTPREQAEKFAYRENGPGSALCLPKDAFQKMLREAGAGHKERGSRKTLKYRVPASVLVLGGDGKGGPVPLYALDRSTRLVDYEVHSCSAVNPFTKGRVMSHRPRLDEWAFRLLVRINTSLMASMMVRQLFEEGGAQIGVGSYRPEKGGTFGIFSVVGWDVRDGRSAIHRSAAE